MISPPYEILPLFSPPPSPPADRTNRFASTLLAILWVVRDVVVATALGLATGIGIDVAVCSLPIDPTAGLGSLAAVLLLQAVINGLVIYATVSAVEHFLHDRDVDEYVGGTMYLTALFLAQARLALIIMAVDPAAIAFGIR